MRAQALLLLVEDSEDDVALLRCAFDQANITNPLQVVRSGGEAVAYLSGFGPYANRAEFPLPALVLLDLRMPGMMDGFEVLQWIRSQPTFKSLRVVVLTASGAAEDISRAYKLGANSYVTKPSSFARLAEVSQAISDFWLRLSQAPEASRPAPAPRQAEDALAKAHPES
ncbi:MAG TPA: response regulator [Candidatus Binatia bacterium]|nr:response regulator [Candidatus Binatia bacterium]